MACARRWSDSFWKPAVRAIGDGLFVITLLFFAGIPVLAATRDDFSPFFGSPALEHCLGDAEYWSFQDGVFNAKANSQRSQNMFLLREERFGNFILKFQARSDGAAVNVLFRASILPPGMLVGFSVPIGGEKWGSLSFLKPIPQRPKEASGELGHATPGFPDALAMPFLREATEVELVRADDSRGAMAIPRNEWVECEIDGLGNRIIVKVNGMTTSRYQLDSTFFERVLGFRPPPAMLGAGGPLNEGMIGFELPPETVGKVELRDLRVRILGAAGASGGGAARDGSNGSKENWNASTAPFDRITDSEWSRESNELLEAARRSEGFHSIFDGKTLSGWRSTAGFWGAQNGAIVGQPSNAFLVTEREYADFILKGSVHLMPPGTNSGVQVRSVVIPDGMRGYQFDMGIPWWGQLYVESTLRGILVPVDDRMKRVKIVHSDGWNDFVIICKGHHMIGELNGEVTYDLVDYYGDETGLIGLQIHAGAPMRVDFKNLVIKELQLRNQSAQ